MVHTLGLLLAHTTPSAEPRISQLPSLRLIFICQVLSLGFRVKSVLLSLTTQITATVDGVTLDCTVRMS